MKFKGKSVDELMKLEEVQKLDEYAGLLEDDVVLVDVDDFTQSEKLLEIVEDLELRCRVYQTTRGKHFLFKNKYNNKYLITKAGTHVKTACGITVDYKLGNKNGYEILKYQGKERTILYDKFENEPYDVVPKFLFPTKSDIDFFHLSEGDGRNQTLFSYILTLQKAKLSKEEIKEVLRIINKYVLHTPLEERELDIIMRDDAFKQEATSFFDGNKFCFDLFARYFLRTEKIIKINGRLHIYDNGVYVEGYHILKQKMIQHIENLTRANRDEVIAYLELICEECMDDLSNYDRYVAFNNGLYDITTDELIEFTPDVIVTNKIPHNYNPNAYYAKTDKMLNDLSCRNEQIRTLLEECIGYCFYRRNELRKSFMLIGGKRNGKSTFLDMLKYLFGDRNTSSLDINEIGDRFRTADIFGKLANIGDDISDEYIPNTNIFKKVVAGNRITVERKGQDPFSFDPYCKFLFSANNFPRLKDKTGAAIDRIVTIPFNAKFDENDPNFDPYIKYKVLNEESMEYLILIGLNGLKRVNKNKTFTIPDEARELNDEYDKMNNPIKLFFEEYDVENQVTKDAYLKYQLFCAENGFQSISQIEFSRQVKKEFGYDIANKKVDGKKYRIFIKDTQ